MIRALLTVLIMAIQLGSQVRAEQNGPVPPSMPPVALAARVEEAPILDGEVLEDPAYATAPVIEGFWQSRPNQGAPASERTEVRIVYTNDTLYFGVMCFDREPNGIIVADSRRDSPLDETDGFQIILDTYLDRQNGFVFGTNPAGIEYDGQVSMEGQGGDSRMPGGRIQAGSGGGFNLNWDGSWEVKTQVSPAGWSAEFAIPFRTLRYPGGKTQTWGLNFQRSIRRHKEIDYWAPLGRQFNLYRLSQAGTLSDLAIPSQRDFKIIPYVKGEVRRLPEKGSPTNWLGDVGGDVKYAVTPSLSLDLTVNTDFAQVEVDEQQVNLDRFTLFFPEKRPFFLENAGLFSVGNPGQVELFFSRRIGIADDGTIIPILGGGRLSGKVGRMNVGLLNMQTAEAQGHAPANNFTVGRISRELPRRSAIGAIFTNRQATGSLAGNNDYNRVFGFDGRLGVGEYGMLSGYMAGSVTPGVNSGEHAFRFNARYASPVWELEADMTQVGDNFNPEVGFLSRGGYRSPQGRIQRRLHPKDFLGVYEFRPHVSYRGFWNFDGFQESGYLHIDNHTEWRNGYEIHTGINLTQEGVTQPFEIYPGVIVPNGSYKHKEALIVFYTNQGAWLSFQSRLTAGGVFGGSRVSWEPSMRLRLGETFNTQVYWSRNDVSLPGGDFLSQLVRLRVSYSFSPRMNLQALIQYNNAANLWSTNVRFSLLQAANTGLFIVYNETRDIEPTLLGIPGRSLAVKFSRIFDLFD